MFHTKDGHVTAYALACGYQESFTLDGCESFHLTESDGVLLKREAGIPTYDIIVRINGDYTGAHQFDTLTEARKFYAQTVRALKEMGNN